MMNTNQRITEQGAIENRVNEILGLSPSLGSTSGESQTSKSPEIGSDEYYESLEDAYMDGYNAGRAEAFEEAFNKLVESVS